MSEYEEVKEAIRDVLCLKCGSRTFKTDRENPRSPNYNRTCILVECSRDGDISAILALKRPDGSRMLGVIAKKQKHESNHLSNWFVNMEKTVVKDMKEEGWKLTVDNGGK